MSDREAACMAGGCYEHRHRAAVELDDIQGLVRFGYKHHTEAVFLLLRVKDRAAARAWLGRAALTNAVSRSSRPRAPRCRWRSPARAARPGCRGDDRRALLGRVRRQAWPSDASRARRLGDVARTIRAAGSGASGERVPHVRCCSMRCRASCRHCSRAIEAQCEEGFEITWPASRHSIWTAPSLSASSTASRSRELDWDRKRPVRQRCQPVLDSTSAAWASTCSAIRTSTAATPTGRCSTRRDAARICRAPRTRPKCRPRPQRQLPRPAPAAPGRVTASGSALDRQAGGERERARAAGERDGRATR